MPGFHKGACAKPQNYANGGFVSKSKREGGPIRGPGTGTSDSIQREIPEGSYIMPADSTQQIGIQALQQMGRGAPIPARVSNGEYQLTPEQVHALGVQVLEQMKDATHTPAPKPRGFKPGLFFSDGGVKKGPLSAAPAAPTPTISGYGGTAVRSAAPAATTPAPASTPAQASTSAPDSNVMFGTQPGTSHSGWRTDAVLNGAAEDADWNWRNGRYMSAIGSAARGAATAIPSAVVDVGETVLEPVAEFGKGLFGVDEGSSSPTTSPASAKAAPAPAKPAPAKPAPAKPATTTPAAPTEAQLTNNVTRVGNSYSGKDIKGDFTVNGQAPGGGTVSAQNDSAAQALSDRYASQDAARGAVLAQAQAQPQSAGFRPNTGLADERLAESRTASLLSAASTPYKGSQNGQLTANQLRTLADIQNQDANRVTASDNAAMHDALTRDLNAQNNAAAAQRALLSEAGTNQRFAATNALDQQKVDLAKESQGFQTRALKRQEDLTAKWEAAKTPEEKSAIAQQIRDLGGREAPNRFTVVPGGQEVDPTTQQLVTRPARVFNNQTGQFMDQGQTPQQRAPQAGEVRNGYRFKGGNPADQKSWEKV